ncbi:MAG: type II toxin-antitoxin system VapC family toxin [Sulfurovum sp.]|nr:type II toxin-antitoxin system VapC family toxin [Sulfurovum sp.]
MIFFDTNVLVYATIDQDKEKMMLSQKLIAQAIKDDTFFISALVLSEYIFILSKLKIIHEQDEKLILFSSLSQGSHNTDTVMDGYSLCKKIDFCKNINDMIHVKVAEEYCEKLVTFDSDFKKLQKYTELEIEIL